VTRDVDVDAEAVVVDREPVGVDGRGCGGGSG
jgi:hypothetical protein